MHEDENRAAADLLAGERIDGLLAALDNRYSKQQIEDIINATGSEAAQPMSQLFLELGLVWQQARQQAGVWTMVLVSCAVLTGFSLAGLWSAPGAAPGPMQAIPVLLGVAAIGFASSKVLKARKQKASLQPLVFYLDSLMTLREKS